MNNNLPPALAALRAGDETNRDGTPERVAGDGTGRAPIIIPRLRKVSWCNLWNRSQAVNGDGYGTKPHLTAAEGSAGKTLCGKSYPADKGYPSTWGASFCKRCVAKAYALGYEKGFTKGLVYVPSREDC